MKRHSLKLNNHAPCVFCNARTRRLATLTDGSIVPTCPACFAARKAA